MPASVANATSLMRRLAPALCLILLTPTSAAQIAPAANPFDVGVQSPTAAGLGKLATADVGHETGAARVSIPLFEVAGRSGLTVPVVLEYVSSGVKVDDVAGWVGMGWTLRAGGAVTRTVLGLPDESGYGYSFTGGRLYDGAAWDGFGDVNPGPAAQALIDDISDGLVDPQPDLFLFSINGRSGRFVMPPPNMGPIRAVPYQRLLIERTGSAAAAWEVTDEEGTVHTFAHVERTSSGLSGPYESSWLLSQMRSANGDDAIAFEYDSRNLTTWHSQWQERVLARSGEGCSAVDQATYDLKAVGVTEHVLRKVVSADQEALFYTSPRAHPLEPGDSSQRYKLDSIEVRTGGALDRTFRFGYQYVGSTGGGRSTTRLFLQSVTEVGRDGTALPPHSFKYDGAPLPGRLAFSQDHWGYANGKPNTTLIPPYNYNGYVIPGADRSPWENSARGGVLTEVTYPTGGRDVFVYGGNERYSSQDGQSVVDLGPMQSRTASADAANGPYSQTATFTVGGLRPTTVNFSYSVAPSSPGQVSLTRYIRIACPSAGIDIVLSEDGAISREITNGTSCTIEAVASQGTFGETPTSSVTASWKEWQSVPPTDDKSGVAAGGLRVEQRTTYPQAGGTPIARRYVYRLADGTGLSSGTGSEPVYATPLVANQCNGTTLVSSSQVTLGAGAGTSYSEVVVLEESSGAFGKTVFRYITVSNGPDGGSTGIIPGAETNYDWMGGHLTEQRLLSSGGALVNRTQNTYASSASGSGTAYAEFRGLAARIYTQPQVGLSGGKRVVGFYAKYRVVSGWHRLAEAVETRH